MFYSVGVFQKRWNANDLRSIECKENMFFSTLKVEGF